MKKYTAISSEGETMKYDVNDLSDTQINLLIAKAQGYAYMEHGGCIHVYLADEDSIYGEGYWDVFDPINNWDQAGYLMDIYKPFINPITNGLIVVEILMDHSSNKDNVTLEYVVAKHQNNIRLAFCRAVVAYHYGYAIEM